MKSYIKGIAIFKDNSPEGKRILKLSKGLNIITGHSKTGKSAVLDIIDWCLGVKDCTIPKGVITDFASLYALLIDLNGKSILLARKDEYKGKNFLHYKEVSDNLTIKDVTLLDFKKTNFLRINEALDKINKIIDLTVNPENLPIDVEKKMPKTNIRSALSYVFQHQDIISSNSRLFYIDPIYTHFPVLAGWYGAEYYIVLDSIDKLQKRIKNLTSRQEKAKNDNFKLENNLQNALRSYYNLIGKEYNSNWTIKECLHQIKNLEDYKKQEYSNKLQNRQEEIDILIEKLLSEQINYDRQISKIKSRIKQGGNYKLFLDKYNQQSNLLDIRNEYSCPICGKDNEKLSIEAIEIIEAKEWLKQELVSVPIHTTKFDTELANLRKKTNELGNQIKILRKEYKKNDAILNKITKEKNLNEQKQKAKWKVLSETEIYNERKIQFDDKYLDELKANLGKFKERKKTYNETEKYDTEKKIIETEMSRIVEKLDFEHKPPELYFELKPNRQETFKLYHNSMGDERIFLRQIGSASNALACHIGLFLSFLNYFSSQPKSKVPSILFFDQPSQVYFPSGTDNTDIEKVGQIYETILDEIERIEKETGIIPQIIVADHIKDLGDKTVKLYEHYFKADWRHGKGLI